MEMFFFYILVFNFSTNYDNRLQGFRLWTISTHYGELSTIAKTLIRLMHYNLDIAELQIEPNQNQLLMNLEGSIFARLVGWLSWWRHNRNVQM